MLATVRYIHRNALDVAGVQSVADYRWSSHRAYLGHRRPAPWLRTDTVMEHFGGDVGAYAEFVENDDAENGPGALHLDPDVLMATVQLVLDEIVGPAGSPAQSVGRTVLILIADRVERRAANNIFASLRFATPEARAAAVRRARRRASTDASLVDVVDRVLELTNTMCLAQRVRRLSA